MEPYKIDSNNNLFNEFLIAHPHGYAYLYELSEFCRKNAVDTVRELGAFQGASASAFFEGGVSSVESIELDPRHLSSEIRSALEDLGSWKLRVESSVNSEALWDEVDLTFLDTVHTYQHVAEELKVHSQTSKKFMAVHDTKYPKSVVKEVGKLDLGPHYQIITAEFCHKKTVGRAVTDFVKMSGQWEMVLNSTSGSGLMIIGRKS